MDGLRLDCSAAKARPNYEFVFIGKAIYDVSKIENHPMCICLDINPTKNYPIMPNFRCCCNTVFGK